MSWAETPLAALADVRSGGGAPQDADDFSDEGHPFVRAGSLIKLLSGATEDSLEKIVPEVARKHGLKLFPAGTVLFAKSGMSATKGHIYALRGEAYVVNHLAALVPRQNSDSAFLSHALQRFSPTGLIKDPAYPSIRLSDIEEMRIRAPRESAERRRIAAILDQADALRRKRRDSLSLLDDFPLSFFDRQFGDPTANPRKIRSTYLGEVSEFGSGGTPAKSNDEYWTGNFPWVSPKDMKRLRISDAADMISDTVFAETNLKKIPAGTPLIVVRGMILAHTVPIAMAVSDLAINQDMKSIHFDDRVLPEFGLWCLKAQHRSILTKVDTAAHGTKRLHSDILKQLPILLPLMTEQRSFVAGIERWEALRHRIESQAEALKSVFASLQNRAFRGEL